MGNKTRSKAVEREAAALLEKLTQEKWQRVPQSGATATTHNTQNHVFNGDVFNEGEYNDICVEVKKMQNMKASHLFEPTQRIKNHMKQAYEESDEKYLLMIKVNYQGWFIYLPEMFSNLSGTDRNCVKLYENVGDMSGKGCLEIYNRDHQMTYKVYHIGQ